MEEKLSAANSDRLFFGLAGTWFVILTFAGFSQSFFLRADPEPLPAYLVLHGIFGSIWVAAFQGQALLITANRFRWHATLGKVWAVIMIPVVLSGAYVVLVKTAAGEKSIDGAGFNLAQFMLFLALGVLAIANRHRPFVHKRLMFFATMMLTVAAADRVAVLVGLEEVRLFRKVLTVAPGIVLVVYDSVITRSFPVLSLAVVAAIWLVIWFNVTDILFMQPVGEAIINALIRAVVG
jgi:hypothetical protein